jgi:hypothetical protein
MATAHTASNNNFFAAFFLAREWRGRPYLISPFLDFMLVGGLAIIVFVALFFVYPPGSPDFSDYTVQVVASMGIIAYLLNDPHFMVSYQMLYHRYPEKLQRFKSHRELWLRYIVAGIAAPAVLALYFLYAMLAQRMELFSFAVQAMLILVGWHYVKQGFGVFIMLSAMKKVYYGTWQRRFLLANSYIVWLSYSLSLFIGGDSSATAQLQDFWGVKYGALPHSELLASFNDMLGGVFILCATLAVLVAIWEKKQPSLTALTGYLSMYYLLFAATFHPLWVLIYPAFHSLQYLMFVYAYKRGEAAHRRQDPVFTPRVITHRLVGFVALAFVLGVLFFDWVPSLLEAWINPHHAFLFPLTAAVIITINIHHYFIDNVIWRKEHAEIGRYIFHRA